MPTYEREETFHIEISESVDEWEAPLILSSFVKRGVRALDPYWSRVWVEQRIVPRDRQNLGDLCADAYRDQSGAEIAFENGSAIRSGIEKGDITYGDIIAVHPFGNGICVLEVTGQQILDALEWGSRAVPGHELHWYSPDRAPAAECLAHGACRDAAGFHYSRLGTVVYIRPCFHGTCA